MCTHTSEPQQRVAPGSTRGTQSGYRIAPMRPAPGVALQTQASASALRLALERTSDMLDFDF